MSVVTLIPKGSASKSVADSLRALADRVEADGNVNAIVVLDAPFSVEFFGPQMRTVTGVGLLHAAVDELKASAHD